MLKTFVRTTTCLAVSAAALIAVTTLDAIAGKAEIAFRPPKRRSPSRRPSRRRPSRPNRRRN